MNKDNIWVVWSEEEDQSIWISTLDFAKNKNIIEELPNFIEAVNAWTFYKSLFGKSNI